MHGKLLSDGACLEYNTDLEVDKGFVVKKSYTHKFENVFALLKSNNDDR